MKQAITFAIALLAPAVTGTAAAQDAETHVRASHDLQASIGRTWTWPSGLTLGGHFTVQDGANVDLECPDDCTVADLTAAAAELALEDVQSAKVTLGYQTERDGYTLDVAAVAEYHVGVNGGDATFAPGAELTLAKDALVAGISYHLAADDVVTIGQRTFGKDDAVRVWIGARF
ncbi:MAG: hypothetical protein OXH38_11795 [Chloroflexi bacterium]|nr:hypothetical protein [Chloroflexota bacterium]